MRGEDPTPAPGQKSRRRDSRSNPPWRTRERARLRRDRRVLSRRRGVRRRRRFALFPRRASPRARLLRFPARTLHSRYAREFVLGLHGRAKSGEGTGFWSRDGGDDGGEVVVVVSAGASSRKISGGSSLELNPPPLDIARRTPPPAPAPFRDAPKPETSGGFSSTSGKRMRGGAVGC